MKPALLALAAVAAAALCGGCSHKPHEYPIRELSDIPDDPNPPHLPKYAPAADHTKPKPLPLAGVLVEVPNSEIVSGVEDVVVHARAIGNDDGSGKDKYDGFTCLISTPDADKPVRPDPRHRKPFRVGLKSSEVKVAMPIGLGVFRGLRPRLTTAVVVAGAEGSTLITWATDRYQWVALIQYTPATGVVPGYVDLLDATGKKIDHKDFSAPLTVVVAEVYSEDGYGNPIWRLLDPSKVADDATIDASCREGWKRAQAAGVIPTTEPYPG